MPFLTARGQLSARVDGQNYRDTFIFHEQHEEIVETGFLFMAMAVVCANVKCFPIIGRLIWTKYTI